MHTDQFLRCKSSQRAPRRGSNYSNELFSPLFLYLAHTILKTPHTDILPEQQEVITNPNPTYLDINVQPTNRIFHGDLHEAPVRDHLKPTREVLTASTGTVYHKMEVDGNANICIRAPRRDLRKNKQNNNKMEPRKIFLFGVRVQTADELPGHMKQQGQGTANVEDHLTHMELEMKRIKGAMMDILRQSDFAKDKDHEMHKQFETLNSTTFYWPMIHIFVLLVTGFAQVRNIVHFFKSRRII